MFNRQKVGITQTSIGLLLLMYAGKTLAGTNEAYVWLQNQIESDGNVTNASIATNLQARSELGMALQQAAQTVMVSADVQGDLSTEALVRGILLTHYNQQNPQTLITKLFTNQNAEGGFAFVKGWQSNVLDTAWALSALYQIDPQGFSTVQQRALTYLLGQQKSNGAFQVVSLDTLYVSAITLKTLTPYIKKDTQVAAAVKKLVQFFIANQVQAGKWTTSADGLFLDAVINDALHDYVSDVAYFDDFKQRAYATQQANGSWADDVYQTAVIAKALREVGSKPEQPLKAQVHFVIKDSETGALLSHVQAVSGDYGSASTINTTSNSRGVVDVEGLAVGHYALTLKLAGYNDLTIEFNVAYGDRLELNDIELVRAVNTDATQITGVVLDQVTGQPIVGAVVSVGDTNTTTDANGRYLISIAQNGQYTLNISSDNYLPQQLNADAKGGALVLNAQLYTPTHYVATLTGKVVDRAGNALANSTITVGQLRVTTNADGLFEVLNAPAGQQNIVISQTGYITNTIPTFIEAGSVANVGVITLSGTNDPTLALAQLTINAVDASNNALANVKVLAEYLDTHGNVTQRLNWLANGGVSHNVTAGTWRLSYSANGYHTVSNTITVTANSTIADSATLILNPYVLKATVLDAQTGKPLNAAPYRIIDATGQTLATGTTDATGYIYVNNINAANITLSIKPNLYAAQQFSYGTVAIVDGVLDAGQLRLRPLSADIKLPDIQLTQINTAGISTDQQSLMATGLLKVSFANQGNAPIWTGKTVQLKAFYDRNHNHQLDGADTLLGNQTVTADLQLSKTNTTSINIAGQAEFKDEPISVWIDATNTVMEQNELNNIKNSAELTLKAPVGNLDPIVKYRWRLEGNQQYLSTDWNTTVIGPIDDTNQDGAIGYGDLPTILLKDRDFAQPYGLNRCCSTIKGLRVVNGSLQKTYTALERGMTLYLSVANFNQDKYPYVISQTGWDGEPNAWGVFDENGTLIKKIYASGTRALFTPLVADIDHDGTPDIFDRRKSWVSSQEYPHIYKSNLNMEGEQLFTIKNATSDDYSWLTSTARGFSSDGRLDTFFVLDYEGIQSPTVASFIYGYNQDKQIVFSDPATANVYKKFPSLAYSTNPQSIVVDDINNDGKVDWIVSTINGSDLALLNDGSILWQKSYQNGEHFSTKTLFDLNDDGTKELISLTNYAVTISAPLSGEVVYRLDHDIDSPGALYSRPLIADVDGDKSADIVINTSSEVVVLSSKGVTWSDTRNIWNTDNYHITNINDDLTVPKYDRPWETHNSYGVQVNYGKQGVPVADVTAAYIRVKDSGSGASSSFAVRVGNAGSKAIPAGTPVSFYRIAAGQTVANKQLLGTVNIAQELPSHHYTDVELNYTGALTDLGTLLVVANDAAGGTATTVDEASTTNNSAQLDIASGNQVLTLQSALNHTAFNADDTLIINATANNFGSFTADTVLRFSVLDSANHVVATLPEQSLSIVANSARTASSTWQIAGQAGAYSVQVSQLLGAKVVAEQMLPFTINRDVVGGVATATSLSTNKQSYSSDDVVAVGVQLRNSTRNSVATNVRTVTTVYNPEGTAIWSQAKDYVQLNATLQVNQSYNIGLNAAKAGTYIVRTITTADDQVAYSTELTFSVQASSQTGSGLTGTISAPSSMVLGQNVTFATNVNYEGNDTLNNHTRRVILINPNDNSGSIVSSVGADSVSLTPKSQSAQNYNWIATGQINQPYIAILQVQLKQADGSAGEWFSLAKTVVGISVPQTTLNVSVDQPNYDINQAIQFTASNNNQSPVALDGAVSTLTVYKPDGSVLNKQYYTINAWAAGTNVNVPYTMRLGTAPAGTYRAEVVTTTATGMVLARHDVNFEVQSSLVTGSGLTGNIIANSANVTVGDTLQMKYDVSNKGNADWTNLPLNIIVYGGNNQVLATYPSTLAALAQGAQSAGTQTWQATGNGNETVRIELTAQINSAIKVLSSTNIYIKPTMMVDVTMPQTAHNNVLVYYSCAHGWFNAVQRFKQGVYSHGCFTQRETILKTYLNRLASTTDLRYTLTSNPTTFKTELRSGQYSNYMVLGAVEKFNPSVNDELREHTYLGNSVMFDGGIRSWLNWELYDLVDVQYRGYNMLSNKTAILQSPIYASPLAGSTVITDDRPVTLQLGSRSVVSATYQVKQCSRMIADAVSAISQPLSITYVGQLHNKPNATIPAVVTAPYGDGKPVALAFDLIDSLNSASTQPTQQAMWQNTLQQTLQYIKPAIRKTTYAAGEGVTLPIVLTNKANSSSTVTIVMDIPQGALWRGETATVVPIGTMQQVRITKTLQANSTSGINGRVQLPSTAATHAIRVAVYPNQNTVGSALFTTEQRFVVLTTAQRFDLLDQTIAKWSALGVDGFKVMAVKLAISKAKVLWQIGAADTAIAVLAEAAEPMQTMQQDVKAARTELDLLLRNMQIAWYNQQKGL